MNIRDLSKYYKLKREIEDLTERLAELGDGVKGIEYKEISVSSSKTSSSIQEKIMLLKTNLIEKRLSALEEYNRIESFIDNVEDLDIRQIMRYRFIDFMKWEEIDNKMFYGTDYSRTKLRRYLKNKNDTI